MGGDKLLIAHRLSESGYHLLRHLFHGTDGVLPGFAHCCRHCLLFGLSAILTAHILRRQFVGLLHESHLVVHIRCPAFLAFKFRFQRGDALQKFLHIRIFLLRLFIETAKRGIQVTVGGGRRADALRCCGLALFRTVIGCQTEIRSGFVSRYFTVEHVSQLHHRAVAVFLAFLQRSLLIGFGLVADNLPVRLVGIRHLHVVAIHTRLFCFVRRWGENQPHRTEEHQHHGRQHNHLLPSQPFRLRERCTLMFGLFLAFLLVGSLVLVLYFNLRLFHINNKVLSDY